MRQMILLMYKENKFRSDIHIVLDSGSIVKRERKRPVINFVIQKPPINMLINTCICNSPH